MTRILLPSCLWGKHSSNGYGTAVHHERNEGRMCQEESGTWGGGMASKQMYRCRYSFWLQSPHIASGFQNTGMIYTRHSDLTLSLPTGGLKFYPIMLTRKARLIRTVLIPRVTQGEGELRRVRVGCRPHHLSSRAGCKVTQAAGGCAVQPRFHRQKNHQSPFALGMIRKRTVTDDMLVVLLFPSNRQAEIEVGWLL